MTVSSDDVVAAAGRIADGIIRTPTVEAPSLAQRLGVATLGPGTNTQVTLLRQADAHLHHAKATGRDRIVTETP